MTQRPFGLDPEALLREELVVDKLDAARRQLESAITMFFTGWDVVSQHTLISAAYGIVYDLATHRGIGGAVKDSPLIGAEDRRSFIKAIHLPQNFFKHATKDHGRGWHSATESATSSCSTRFVFSCSSTVTRPTE